MEPRRTPPEGGPEGGMEPPGSESGAGGGEDAGGEEEAPAPPPPLLLETPPLAVELPPCHGPPGPALAELPPARELLLPPPPPQEPPARGHCLLRNWQEERATNALDQVPSSPEDGTEGFFYRHGHRGLLTLRFGEGLAGSSTSTTKDSFQRPWPTGRPVRGQREAMLEWLLYQKYSKEVFEEDVDPPRGPMESLSTTRQDYHRKGFPSAPPTPTKPHNYRLEQPQSFWREHARQVPGVSHIQTGDTPFKKNASFSTPATESLDPPLPYGPENYPKL